MRYSRRQLAIIVILVLWGLMTHPTYAGQGDEPHYLAIAHSIAFDRDFAVANNYGSREPLIGSGGLVPGEHVRAGKDGTIRPVHDVGLPLVVAPYVALTAPLVRRSGRYSDRPIMRRFRLSPSILYRHVIGFAMIGVAALLAALMYESFLDLGARQRTAFWTALLVATSPPLLIFGVLLFTELLSALCCLFVFRRVALSSDGTTFDWAATGVAAGFLVLLHIKNVSIAVPLALLGALTLVERRRRSELAAFAGGLTAVVLLRTLIVYRFWGSLITTPHARTGEWHGLAEIWSTALTRFAGLLVDQEFGLLPYAPVLLASVWGWIVLLRHRRTLAVQLGCVVAVHFLVIALPVINPYGWTGAWSPAARFMTPVVPLLALPLVVAFVRLPQTLVFALVALQLTINAYMWQNPKNLWNDGDGVAAVCERGGMRFCSYLPTVPNK